MVDTAVEIASPWREDFPALSRKVHGNKTLAFLDSGASAQKPLCVIEAMDSVLRGGYANIHRGLYEISQELSQSYEDVRSKVARFIHAPSDRNIVFTSNATESINMVAQSWARVHLRAGDEILLTGLEHHANIVPWYLLADQIDIKIKVAPFCDDGTLDLEGFYSLLSERTRLVSMTQMSNVLGVINPISDIVAELRKRVPEAKILVDGSQGIVHFGADVSDMDVDFYAFTGHKLYGPTGIGVLYGKAEMLGAMRPFKGGGDMIATVSHSKGITYRDSPFHLEAGTPPIVEVIGLGAAIDYISEIGMDPIKTHERAIGDYAAGALQDIEGVCLYGTQDINKKSGIFSFNVGGAHSSDVGTILDQCGVAVRTGHHCAMPLMEILGVCSTVRASLGLYTNKDDIDALVMGLRKVKEFF